MSFQTVQKQAHGRGNVADHRCGDRTVAVNFDGINVELDEFVVRIPVPAPAVSEQPVEAGTDQHDHVGVFQYERTCRGRALRVVVGQQSLGH